MESAKERVQREDVLLFLNGCLAATGQGTFYRSRFEQGLGIAFLHEYVRVNYRGLYALTLAASINDYNRALIVRGLLTNPSTEQHRLEGELIGAALAAMPPQRVYRLFAQLKKARVNNRRTRAVMRDYVRVRPVALDALKYRRGLSAAARHARVPMNDELGDFLFRWRTRPHYEDELLESWRAAHFAKSAMYALPYTVAEGFASKHGVPRAEFLEKIAPRMTRQERERTMREAERHGVVTDIDLWSLPLLRLCTVVLSMNASERRARVDEIVGALRAAAKSALPRELMMLDGYRRIVLVLDDSYSMVGTRSAHQRPLAIALALQYLFEATGRVVATHRLSDRGRSPSAEEGIVGRRAVGESDVARGLLDALDDDPDLVLVVSDGFDNDPPGATHAMLELYRKRLGGACSFVQVNPVFDPLNFSPRALSSHMMCVGVRRPEDVFVGLAFSRFASGESDGRALEHTLTSMAQRFVAHHSRSRP